MFPSELYFFVLISSAHYCKQSQFGCFWFVPGSCKYLLSIIIGCATTSSKNLVDHDCDGHIGAIARAFIDSNYILFRTGHIMLNGGNKYTNWFFQLIDIASTYKASGSVNQQFLIESRCKRSISSMPKHAIKWLKMFLDSIHSDASWNFLDAVSANIFCLPRLWAADTFIYFQFIYRWHIYFNYN